MDVRALWAGNQLPSHGGHCEDCIAPIWGKNWQCCQWGIPHADFQPYNTPPDIRDTPQYSDVPQTALEGSRPAADRHQPLENYLRRNLQASRTDIAHDVTARDLYDPTKTTEVLRPHIEALCPEAGGPGKWDPESIVGTHWRRELDYAEMRAGPANPYQVRSEVPWITGDPSVPALMPAALHALRDTLRGAVHTAGRQLDDLHRHYRDWDANLCDQMRQRGRLPPTIPTGRTPHNRSDWPRYT